MFYFLNLIKLDAVVLKFNYFSVPRNTTDMYAGITFYRFSSSVLYF